MAKNSVFITAWAKFKHVLITTVFLRLLLIETAASNPPNHVIDICTPLELSYSSDLRSLVERSYKELEFDVRWHILPANRCLSMVDKGMLDADLVRSPAIVEQYDNLFMVPVELMTIGISLYGLKDPDGDVPSPELLLADKSLSVAYPRNAIVVEQMIKNPGSIGTDNGEHMLTLLKKKRVDFALIPEVEVEKMHRAGVDMEGMVLIRKNYIQFPVFHVLNRQHAGLAERLADFFQTALSGTEISKKK